MSKSVEETTTVVDGDTVPFNLTDVDRATLAQTDEEFVPHSWEELQEIVRANDLSAFKRYPSQLRRYLSWSREIKATYGSIPNFVCQERLHWSPSSSEANPQGTTSNGTQASGFEPQKTIPFADPADYKILRNDWPYATPPDIAHLVIWLKTPLAVSKLNGHLLPEGRAQIQTFVEEKFVKPLKEIYGGKEGKDLILWFKNYPALQSVGALEHFHCFVRGADDAMLWEWTGEGKRVMM